MIKSLINKKNLSGKISTQRKGLSFVEVGVVTAIIILIAAIGVPSINDFVTENRAPKVAEELQRFIARTKAASAPINGKPYDGIATIQLARSAKSSSVLTSSVDGGGEVKHRLGDGVITVESIDNGEGFSITVDGVSSVVCPTLATIMQSTVDAIAINSTTTVKDADNSYNGIVAESACEEGNNNTFIFKING